MGLQYALLFTFVGAVEVWAQYKRWTPDFHWTRKMTIKNPENSPTFNYAELGSLQDAWQVLEDTSNDSYYLMFRTEAPMGSTRCVSMTANITNKTNKTANFTITFYDTEEEEYENVTIQVRALKQPDYLLENVVRANLDGKLPDATPVPPGSYTYAENDNFTCYSRSTPFPDGVNVAERLLGAEDYDGLRKKVLNELFPIPESLLYVDTYVVFNQPECYILRSPSTLGGCDLWLRKTELKRIVEDLGDQIVKQEQKLKKESEEKYGVYENCTARDDQEEDVKFDVEDGIERWFQDIAWKQVSLDCILAFMIACGEPLFRVYNPVTCNSSLTGQYLPVS
uniref:Putative salivary lipocalin n=1 Tax=Ixodes ricinus TaxID=34613 RepID=A0A0K8RE04_IXORI